MSPPAINQQQEQEMTDLDFTAFADILPAPRKRLRAPRKRRYAPRAKFELKVAGSCGSMTIAGTKRDLLAEFDHAVATVRDEDHRITLYRNGYVVKQWKREALIRSSEEEVAQ